MIPRISVRVSVLTLMLAVNIMDLETSNRIIRAGGKHGAGLYFLFAPASCPMENEITQSTENNQNHVCIRSAWRVGPSVFHSWLVFLPRVMSQEPKCVALSGTVGGFNTKTQTWSALTDHKQIFSWKWCKTVRQFQLSTNSNLKMYLKINL